MSIEIATLTANAIQIALMVVFGLWVKHFVDQQLKSKDASIQALESVIKSKDSEIARLEKSSAPAIAEAYQRVKEFAESVAKDASDLKKKLQEIESEQKIAQDSVGTLVHEARLKVASSTIDILTRRLNEIPKKPIYGGSDLLAVLKNIIDDTKKMNEEINKSNPFRSGSMQSEPKLPGKSPVSEGPS